MNTRKLLDAAVRSERMVTVTVGSEEIGPSPIMDMNLQSVGLMVGKRMCRIKIGDIKMVEYDLTECLS